jgi:hypothetical protein
MNRAINEQSIGPVSLSAPATRSAPSAWRRKTWPNRRCGGEGVLCGVRWKMRVDASSTTWRAKGWGHGRGCGAEELERAPEEEPRRRQRAVVVSRRREIFHRGTFVILALSWFSRPDPDVQINLGRREYSISQDVPDLIWTGAQVQDKVSPKIIPKSS